MMRDGEWSVHVVECVLLGWRSEERERRREGGWCGPTIMHDTLHTRIEAS